MPEFQYRILQCTQPACRLRFPVTSNDVISDTCPLCGAKTQNLDSPWNIQPKNLIGKWEASGELLVLLDNIRSAWNVGSMFRTCDGAGASHIYLCGITPTPQHHNVAKTSLGAENTVSWSYHTNSLDLASQLIAQGKQLIAIELSNEAISLFQSQAVKTPIVLVVGNEICGVDPGLLALCNRTYFIPMAGSKESLNAAVAFGIAIYFLRTLL